MEIKPAVFVGHELGVDIEKLDTALKLFGAQGNDMIEAFHRDDGVLELSNGRHRVCIARLLRILCGIGMKLGVIVEERLGDGK